MSTLKAVIFDHTTLRITDPTHIRELIDTFNRLRQRGVRIVSFSNEISKQQMEAELKQRGIPPLDLFVGRRNMAHMNKGTGAWIAFTRTSLNLRFHELLYVGDDEQDWREASKKGVFYVQAEWAARPRHVEYSCYFAPTPSEVYKFASHFLLSPTRFQFSLDRPIDCFYFRGLLHKDIRLAVSNQNTVSLIDLLHNNVSVPVNGEDAADLLCMHALSSLYLEGLIKPNPLFVIYPSSTPGRVNLVLEKFFENAPKFFRGEYSKQLLFRWQAAIDTSFARSRRQHHLVSYQTQTDSVALSRAYENSLRDRDLVVVDDFVTTGKSLDWARNLLNAGGASSIVLLAIGKYYSNYEMYVPKREGVVEPFELKNYVPNTSFQVEPLAIPETAANAQIIKKSFQEWRDGNFLD